MCDVILTFMEADEASALLRKITGISEKRDSREFHASIDTQFEPIYTNSKDMVVVTQLVVYLIL